MTIDEVWLGCRADLERVDRRLLDLMSSDAPVTTAVGRHLVAGGGKRIRPLLLILSARMYGYQGDMDAVLGAIIEAIHSASLLHDDVVDGASVRRNRPAAHSLWGSQITVLVGDFLYSNALRAAVELGNQQIMEILSRATTKMTEGELFQLGKIGDTKLTVEDYERIIEGKTSALIGAACRLGPVIAGKPEHEEERMGAFGAALGTAFQVVDDVLDYQAEPSKTGKTIGTDLMEGKLTLPLILLMERADAASRKALGAILAKDEPGGDDVAEVVGLLTHYACLEDALARAEGYVGEAMKLLDACDDSQAKDGLCAVAEYALRRDR